jgi:hypothetical protein
VPELRIFVRLNYFYKFIKYNKKVYIFLNTPKLYSIQPAIEEKIGTGPQKTESRFVGCSGLGTKLKWAAAGPCQSCRSEFSLYFLFQFANLYHRFEIYQKYTSTAMAYRRGVQQLAAAAIRHGVYIPTAVTHVG